MPDVSKIDNKEALKELYLKFHPNEKKMRIVRMVGQIWDFAKEIKKGDIIALPLKLQSSIALGKVEGDYEFKEITSTIKHIRPVKWLQMVARSEFDQDLLFSLGAFTTVCQIKRNDAESRMLKILEKRESSERYSTTMTITESTEPRRNLDPTEMVDIEQHSKDQIIKYIGAKFSGHNLSRLVDTHRNA